MLIGDRLCNPQFSFNAPVRVLHYLGTDDDTETVFDSTESGDFPYDLAFKSISAINTGDDGVLEIEYVDLIGD